MNTATSMMVLTVSGIELQIVGLVTEMISAVPRRPTRTRDD